jgi:signal transduction histidine kinase
LSLRLRLFLSYAAIVFITFGLVALGAIILVRAYADRLTLERLGEITSPIYVHVNSLLQEGASTDQIWASMQEQADNSSLYVVAVDDEEYIVKVITPRGAQTLLHFPSGELTNRTQGSFRSNGKVYLWVAYALGPNGSSVLGASRVVAVLPRPPIATVLARVLRPIALAMLIALLASLLVAFLLARSIYRPLGNLATGVKKVAAGDYTQKVNVDGPPEVVALAHDFNNMTQEVAASQLRLRQFVADTSHELRSPLTSIQGFAQALLDGTAADEATRVKAAGIIAVEAGRLRRQVDELLELSRIQAGQDTMAHEPVDLDEVLARVAAIYGIQADEKRIELIVDAPPGLTIMGDADRLEQVFNNLLDNAIKNSPSDSTVKLTSVRLDGWINTTIADNGPGIPADHLPHVFQRFYQVPGVRTGVGLGLAIAQEIVRAHGGHITVCSSFGEGAKFIVSLPATQV